MSEIRKNDWVITWIIIAISVIMAIHYIFQIPHIPPNTIPVGVCGDRYQTQPCINPEIPVEYYMALSNISSIDYFCNYSAACFKENCTDDPSHDNWVMCDRCVIECVNWSKQGEP
jgi:hypothetical protein